MTTETGRIDLEIPRDRQATFDPQFDRQVPAAVPALRRQDHVDVRPRHERPEITGHLRELYGIEVSPDLVSAVTDAVLDEIAAWQARPLEPVYSAGVLRCAAGQGP